MTYLKLNILFFFLRFLSCIVYISFEYTFDFVTRVLYDCLSLSVPFCLYRNILLTEFHIKKKNTKSSWIFFLMLRICIIHTTIHTFYIIFRVSETENSLPMSCIVCVCASSLRCIIFTVWNTILAFVVVKIYVLLM